MDRTSVWMLRTFMDSQETVKPKETPPKPIAPPIIEVASPSETRQKSVWNYAEWAYPKA